MSIRENTQRANNISYEIVTPPATQAVDLDTVKSFLRVSHNNDDAQLTSLIIAAQNKIESLVGRSLIDQTIRVTRDYFYDSVNLNYATLYRGPVKTLVSVTANGNAISNVELINNTPESDQARVTGSVFEPVDLGGVKIEYTVGYGAASDVPEAIINAILWYLVELYDSPSAKIPAISRNLLQPYLIPRI
jgi:uncharacterized phiE125 gp8 family phage protein